jgi:hypothetical protein
VEKRKVVDLADECQVEGVALVVESIWEEVLAVELLEVECWSVLVEHSCHLFQLS